MDSESSENHHELSPKKAPYSFRDGVSFMSTWFPCHLVHLI